MSLATRRSAVLLALAGAVAASSRARAADPMSTLDPDKDGTISLDEAKNAADKMFDALDKDRDGTLDRLELKGRVAASSYRKVDTDDDKLIDKGEYLALVTGRFQAADRDDDGTLDAQELKTPAGRSLLSLIR